MILTAEEFVGRRGGASWVHRWHRVDRLLIWAAGWGQGAFVQMVQGRQIDKYTNKLYTVENQ